MAERARYIAGRVGRSYSASTTSPTAPGFAPLAPDRANRDPKMVERMRSNDALYGRITYGAGPTPTRYSAYVGTGIEPTTIWDVQMQRNIGYPQLWVDLCEQTIERDGHLGGISETRRLSVVDKPFRLHPARRGDDFAAVISKIVERIVDQIDAFDQTIEDLLSAPAYGYALSEIVWSIVRVRIPLLDGTLTTVELAVPRSIEWVHWKHVRFNRDTDEPYLWMGREGEYSLPPYKFIFHASAGSGLIERRGYMGSCVWLSAAKRWSERDWLVYAKIFGIPQILAQFPNGAEEYDTHRTKYAQILKDWGEGIPALLPDELTVNISREAGGRGGDLHGSLIGWANTEMSKRILGSTLTVEMGGGQGSYALADTHRDAPYMRSRADARKLAATLRRDLLTPIVAVNSEALARVLGVEPIDLVDNVPRCSWRIEREMTPLDRQKVYEGAVNELGAEIDQDDYFDEMGFNAPRPGGTALRGKPIAIGAGGLAPSVEASKSGADPAPKPGDASAKTQDDGASPALPPHEEEEPGDKPGDDSRKTPTDSIKGKPVESKIELTPSDVAAIVTVDEARGSLALDGFGKDGDLTVAEFKAKHSSVIADAAAASDGEAPKKNNPEDDT